MRGFVMSEGKISKQASLSETGLGNVAPLLVYQYIAAVTSQYYQHIITEKLISIDNKLDIIISVLSADDRAKLKVAYNRFVELSKKTTYDIAEKQIVSEFVHVFPLNNLFMLQYISDFDVYLTLYYANVLIC